MSSISDVRHTLAHLLAQAVLEHYPSAVLTLGPAVDNGFYYDIDFKDVSLSDTELGKIQKSMRKNIKKWTEFTHEVVSRDEALARFAGNVYKTELINEIADRGETITLYTCGGFTDLCRGGHAENPAAEIDTDSFKLDRVAGAYWRGDEKNPMLTRIYGLAFASPAELDAYIVQREEAIKRDHRKVGVEQDLFTFSDLVGSGMPLYTPRGNIVRNAIINYSRELNARLGFGEVHTPNVNKAELFKISGHYDAYKEDMMSVRSQYVEDEMFLKPMNCPQHTQIYSSRPRSYRDLPIRYADFANLYRDERPGQLSGLTRLRSFAQDDGHIFCREDQVEAELLNVLDVVKDALSTYGVGYWIRLSLRDPNNKEKYLGSDEAWEQSQSQLLSILEKSGVEFKPAEGEAAFYGPKLDIMAVDALGREWQISTIQVDRTMPTRFGLEYMGDDGTKKTPVMIHRALIGSPDRFMGILIEHYAGAFPLWMAPVQVRVLPVSEKHTDYAAAAVDTLLQNGIRAELDHSDSLGKRIRNVKVQKIPYYIVVGDEEVNATTVTVENRAGAKNTESIESFIERLKRDISSRSL
ncbi:MAG: threonine--tRNA ligase [Candidatus Pacebacteria bacterium]|nr:threonine--tRNA ligase [Candidatus Paceibacterota bacterium]